MIKTKIITNNQKIPKIILLYQYYKVKENKEVFENELYVESRQKEIDYCLIKNSENTFIDEIHLLVEEIFDLSFVPNLHKVKQILIYKRLTYYSAIQYYNARLSNEICILCNSDIYFDDNINFIKNIDFSLRIILALTRYNLFSKNGISLLNGKECDESVKASYIKPYQMTIWSQDVWIWKSNHVIVSKNADFHLGRVGCDNYIAYLFHMSNYSVINPSQLVCCYHYDLLSFNKCQHGYMSFGNISFKREERIKDLSSYVFLDNLDDIPDKYTTSVEKIFIKKSKPIIVTSKFIKKNIYEIINYGVEASSYFDSYFPAEVSFHSEKEWRPDTENDSVPYIHFNFEKTCIISIIDMKGKNVSYFDLSQGCVSSFKISYMETDSGIWNDYPTIFEGMHSQCGNFIKRIYLDTNIICKKIRFYPLIFFGIPAMKIRMYSLN